MPVHTKIVLFSFFLNVSFVFRLLFLFLGVRIYSVLFLNKNFFSLLVGIYNNPTNGEFIKFVGEELQIELPDSFDKFKNLDYQEVEKISGVVVLLNRMNEDNISFNLSENC